MMQQVLLSTLRVPISGITVTAGPYPACGDAAVPAFVS